MDTKPKKIKFVFFVSLFPFRSLLKKLGIKYDIVKVANDYYREDFIKVPIKHIAVVLPHCLIHDRCSAKFSKEDGIVCVSCGLCRCGEIREICEEKGCQFYITSSAGFSKRLTQRRKIKAAIGAVCTYELKKGLQNQKITLKGVKLKKSEVIPQTILTSRYDCLDNNIDWELLKRMIAEIG